MSRFEEVITQIAQEETRKANRKLTMHWLNRDRALLNQRIRTEHFNSNQKVQGLTPDKMARVLAQVPEDVYFRLSDLHGPQYWHKLENIRKHKQYLLVDRI